ncbi:thermonuclease family protein [Saccharibacillus kuerlensis]|uniref:Endonuclease YncB n=1 Tax=Saccharibacillus kuerlensis TaxID=459527 RepID=A0ABQ2L671_9BACL|nr:thermonuclease family protein [Saccharibacillus kuerlensis]GGO04760.1 endonuclease YncB [Saccharibacillus kuerlensis]
MKSPGNQENRNGQTGGRPKRSLISIVATVVVLGLLLFTDMGRSLLGNLLNQDETSQNGTSQNGAEQTGNVSTSVEGRLSAEVERVVDGDTFIANMEDGSRERIRMLLIDTPETKKEGTPVQPFGTEASDYAKRLLNGRNVELEFDKEQRDQYDRMLAYVYLDGEMVNEKMLEQGLARVVVYKPNDKYVEQFREIQAEAKRQKLGVWSIDGYADNRGFHPEAAAAEVN